MRKLTPITSAQYSHIIEPYTSPLPPYDGLFDASRKDADIRDILLHNWYIQHALYHFCTTRSTGMTVSLPIAGFVPEEWCALFRHLRVTGTDGTRLSCSLHRPEKAVLDTFIRCAQEKLLHPLIMESLRTCSQQGEIPINARWVFREYTGGEAPAANPDDLLLRTLRHAPGKGAFEIPAYLTEEQVEKEPLFDVVSAQSDKLLLVGYEEDGRFISHAALALYTHPTPEISVTLQSLGVHLPSATVSGEISCEVHVWRNINENSEEK